MYIGKPEDHPVAKAIQNLIAANNATGNGASYNIVTAAMKELGSAIIRETPIVNHTLD